MEKPWTYATESSDESERETAHRKLALTAAEESIVLLENDGTLPIMPCKVALYGAGAGMTIKGGSGSGEVNERHSVSIWEGLKNAGFTVTTEAWLRKYEEECKALKAVHNRGLAKTVLFGSASEKINIMSNAFRYPVGREITDWNVIESGTDFCIYVLARQAGESTDRSLENHEYTLEEDEIKNIKKAVESYKRTIVVINVGGSMDISSLLEIKGVNAIIFFCQQGMEGGNAFANIITGKVTPSGKLTDTWAKAYTDIPYAMEYSYLNGDTNEYYKEGIYVGYRYFDSFQVAPRYEFGYGLSYTDFSVECTGAEINGTEITVTARVTNTGIEFSGKQVVQLYVSCPSGRMTREFQGLAAFGKTRALIPGETEDITLQFDLLDLAGFHEPSSCFLLEKGTYVLRLGSSSGDTRICAAAELEKTVIARQCTPICPVKDAFEELTGSEFPTPALPENTIRLSLQAAEIKRTTHTYGKTQKTDARTEEILNTLTLKEMLDLVVGTGNLNRNPIFNLSGAAAYTSAIPQKGICNIALADGPAGLRVQRRAVIHKGKIKPLEASMEFMEYFPTLIKKYLQGNPKKGTIVYQYATAFPVATALAQTWNTALLEQIGRAIGMEMTEYGATYWLAPGINIHRNPLCGRNYEYFSEDPLLTGKMAAAITKGVQSFEGCYVTLKHYAANNQETNRMLSDSILSERALREIYLKAFGIAVTEGGAKGVMTSYNKVNGIYAPNSHDLCTKVLRDEWGFDGVVMTDWLSTGEELAGNGAALKAGNDLIMPGGSKFKKMLAKDLRDENVSEMDIRRCCYNVLNAVLNSKIQKEFAKI